MSDRAEAPDVIGITRTLRTARVHPRGKLDRGPGMRRLAAWCLGGVFISVSTASGLTEYGLGGRDGNPWEAALSLDGAGEYVVTDESGQLLRRVVVATTPFGVGADTLIDFSDTSIQPRFIDPAVNLALTQPGTDPQSIPLGYTGGKAEATDRCTHQGKERRIIKKMHDGDPATAMFRGFTQDPQLPPGFGTGWGGLGRDFAGPKAAVLDFGAAVPVGRIRFYPRLSRRDDRLLIEEFADPKPPLDAFGEDSFADNFLAWYEIRVGDNTPVFRRGSCDALGVGRGLPWVVPEDPQLEVLKSTRENLDVVVDLRFPTRSIRWVSLQPFPLRNWEIAELEVYGEGYVNETAFITQILDFGKPINWGKIRWSGALPEGTRVEIRTRTGDAADPNLYFAESTNGDLQQISLADYNRIDVSGRLPTVYDSDDWSFWSPPYDYVVGLRNELQPAEAWNDGTSLLSPGPSRYLQIDIRLFATFAAAPRLDQLWLQFAEAPSAQEVVGEIWPIEVTSFEPATFTYVVRPIFKPGDIGFDRLEILTTTRVDTIRAVTINDDQVDLGLFPPAIEADRLVIAFPALKDEKEDSRKQVDVVFDTAVLSFGTEFRSWVFSSEDPDGIKQSVDPGNATFRFPGNVLAVQTPLGGDLLLQVKAQPELFTPNGDGVNEAITFSYKLRQVTAARPVLLRIYDLAGTLVHQLPVTRATSGAFASSWNGRDAVNRLVPPGIYLYELTLEAEDEERKIGTFAVAY